MKIHRNSRQSLVPLAEDEGVPLELEIGRSQIQVWLDSGGIHFKRGGTAGGEGHLSWDMALALSLVTDSNMTH